MPKDLVWRRTGGPIQHLIRVQTRTKKYFGWTTIGLIEWDGARLPLKGSYLKDFRRSQQKPVGALHLSLTTRLRE